MTTSSQEIISDVRVITVRMPDDLIARLDVMAKFERRDRTAQILWVLERHLTEWEHERAYLPGSETPPPPSRS